MYLIPEQVAFIFWVSLFSSVWWSPLLLTFRTVVSISGLKHWKAFGNCQKSRNCYNHTMSLRLHCPVLAAFLPSLPPACIRCCCLLLECSSCYVSVVKSPPSLMAQSKFSFLSVLPKQSPALLPSVYTQHFVFRAVTTSWFTCWFVGTIDVFCHIVYLRAESTPCQGHSCFCPQGWYRVYSVQEPYYTIGLFVMTRSGSLEVINVLEPGGRRWVARLQGSGL